MNKSHKTCNRKCKYFERLKRISSRSSHQASSNAKRTSHTKASFNVSNIHDKTDEETQFLEKIDRKDHGVMSFVVGGRLFQTFASTLITKYGTRLSWLAQGRGRPLVSQDFEHRDGVYYFDRDPDFFGYILQYYRTDELHLPRDTCTEFIQQEMRFWGISEYHIQPCCLANFKALHGASVHLQPMEEKIDRVMTYREENFVEYLNLKKLGTFRKFRCHLRTMFDDIYRMSLSGKMYAIIAIIMTLLQLISTSLMTTTPFRVCASSVTVHRHVLSLFASDPRSFLLGVDILCLIYFFIEYKLRLLATRHIGKFLFTNILNINDLFCNVTSLVTLIILLTATNNKLPIEVVFYMARVLRVLRFLRYIRRLEVVIVTFRSCSRELVLFSTFCLIGIVISGVLVYLAELVQEHPDNQMTNMFTAFYFAIISWTTVGYGDVVPKSTLSHIFTVVICWVATITILLPIPLMANTFAFFYRHFHHTVKRADLRGRLRMKRILQRHVEGDPAILYESTLSSISSVSAPSYEKQNPWSP